MIAIVCTESAPAATTCPVCGDRLGYYEPLHCRLQDGTVAEGGLLALRDAGVGAEIFHTACLPAAVGGAGAGAGAEGFHTARLRTAAPGDGAARLSRSART